MKPKNSRRQKLRKQIAHAQAQPRCLYGPELKREIVQYTTALQSRGATQREIAADLGLSYKQLCSWTRHAKRRQDTGKLPFERTAADTLPMPRTAPPASAPVAAPAQQEVSPSTAELYLLLRADHVHLTAESRETLLRWLSETPPAKPPAATSP